MNQTSLLAGHVAPLPPAEQLASVPRDTLSSGRGTGSVPIEPLTTDILRGGSDVISSLRNEWNDLLEEGPCHEPFYTPDWLTAWIESFAVDATIVLIVARRNGHLRGILPLVERRYGVGPLRFIRLKSPTNEHSNRLDLLHGAGDRDEVIAAVWETLETRVKWDLIEYRDVPEGGAVQKMARASSSGWPVMERPTLESPYIAIPDDLDLAQAGPAKQLRRWRRNLEKAGTYECLRRDPTDLAAVNRYLELEAAGWKGKAGTAIACDEDTRRFYRSIMTERKARFTPVIHEIRLNGRPIAVKMGFEMGNVYVEPKGTYSEEHRNFGLGHLIVFEILSSLKSRNYAEYDLLGHVEPYKELWTTTTRQHYHYLVFRKGLKGKAARWGVEQLVPWAKRWRKRMVDKRSKSAVSPSSTDGHVGTSA